MKSALKWIKQNFGEAFPLFYVCIHKYMCVHIYPSMHRSSALPERPTLHPNFYSMYYVLHNSFYLPVNVVNSA